MKSTEIVHDDTGIVHDDTETVHDDTETVHDDTDQRRRETEYRSIDESIEVMVGIPAYNEEVGIGSTVLAASEHADCVVVVNDGSTDRTGKTARMAGALVIDHETNRGKGAAIKSILEFAKEQDCSVLVLLDGDGQHVPTDIPSVITPALEGDADLVIGNRHHRNHPRIETPLYRRIGQRILDALTRFSTGADVTDSQSGFRALSPAAIEAISPKTTGIGIESEMIDTAVKHDLEISEVPIGVRYEGIDGQTHNAVYHGIAVVFRLFSLARERHPLAFYGGPGLLLTALGVMKWRSESEHVGDGHAVRANGTGSSIRSETSIHPGTSIRSGTSFRSLPKKSAFILLVGMCWGIALNQITNSITTRSVTEE